MLRNDSSRVIFNSPHVLIIHSVSGDSTRHAIRKNRVVPRMDQAAISAPQENLSPGMHRTKFKNVMLTGFIQ
jgi:hypothetical protein